MRVSNLAMLVMAFEIVCIGLIPGINELIPTVVIAKMKSVLTLVVDLIFICFK
jgi:hypothetical protein